MQRNQRASRVPSSFLRSQIKVPHKTLQYINFQNFNHHAFRAEFTFFIVFYHGEYTSETNVYSYILRKNSSYIDATMFLYYLPE